MGYWSRRKETKMKIKMIKAKSLEEAKAGAPDGTSFILTHTILDDSGTGGFCGFYATPKEKAEYEDGMAKLAEMG